jgi:uncharacterized protein YciI
MYFLVLASDKPGMAVVRQETRPAHRLYLRQPPDARVTVHLGGPTLDSSAQQMDGTLLVVDAPSLAAVESFVQSDPYCQAGLFAEVVIKPWAWSLGTPAGPNP